MGISILRKGLYIETGDPFLKWVMSYKGKFKEILFRLKKKYKKFQYNMLSYK